jgi:hypothetical protein
MTNDQAIICDKLRYCPIIDINNCRLEIIPENVTQIVSLGKMDLGR